jgi:TonB family protein
LELKVSDLLSKAAKVSTPTKLCFVALGIAIMLNLPFADSHNGPKPVTSAANPPLPGLPSMLTPSPQSNSQPRLGLLKTNQAEPLSLTGQFHGVLRNQSVGRSAAFQITVQDLNGILSGSMLVDPPLVGSGALSGSRSGPIITFVVKSSFLMLTFRGTFSKNGISGTYRVERSEGSQENGTFSLSRVSSVNPQVSSGLEPEPFDKRFRWYVEQVKSKVKQNWYLSDILDSPPAGSTVYVQFQIGKDGSHGDVSVQTSSGHQSLDQSCLNAVERTDNFGPLPAGYEEKALNVLYHCTYPGPSIQSSPAPAASYNLPSPASAPALQPMVVPVDKAWHDYTNMVSALIDQRWRKTGYAGEFRGWVGIRFSVAPDGLVGDPTVTVSSGSAAVDAACKAAVGEPIGWYAPRLPEGYNSPVFLAYVCK